MAIWDRNKVLPSALNSGNEYVEGDFPTEETLNAANNNAFYSVDFTEALADAPDNTEAGNIGTPAVTLIDNVKTIDGVSKTFKKFKFANLKGEKGDAGINDALVVQTFGTSTEDAISQKVITDKFDELDEQLNAVPISDTSYGLIEAFENAETAVMQNLVIKGLTATQLITNGLTQTVTAYANTMFIWGQVNLIQGHKYYITAKTTLVSGDVTPATGSIRSESPTKVVLLSGGLTSINSPLTQSAIVDWTEESRLNHKLIFYGSNDDGTVKCENLIFIDLTDTFGAGNEPDLATCQTLFPSYFDGTISVDKGEVSVGTGTAITRARYPKLQSVPAIQDTFNVLSGLHTQNVYKDSDISGADYYALYTTPVNVDYVYTEPFALALHSSDTIAQGRIRYYDKNGTNLQEVAFTNIDNVANIGKFSYGSGKRIAIVIAKGTYATITEARTGLGTTSAILSLATPVLTYYPPKSIPLEINSSIIHQSIMSDIVFYSTGIAITDTDYPISALQEVYKVDTETGAETPIDIATCTVAVDGLSFTSTALTDGDLVWFRYSHALQSLVPTTDYTYTTSLAGGLTTIQQDTKKQSESLQKQIDELRAIIASMAV